MLEAFVGGAAIGLAATLVWSAVQRTAGMSSIVAGVLRPVQGQLAWRLWFLAGLLAGGLVLRAVAPQQLGASPASLGTLVLAGGLVGFGTRLSGGCTSGHGVCGIGSGAVRSVWATLVFLAVGVAVATSVYGVR